MNDNFIDSFLEYTSSYESPTDFFYWAALAGIAAVMRDSCYILLGDTKIFPNLYVLIIANPAMRKAKPLNSIIELCKTVSNTKIIEGRTSVQAVIQRLGDIQRTPDGRTLKGASGIIYSEELSAMFTDDDANIPVLTDLYDFKTTYTSALVTRGTTTLSNVVVTLLGASNEELLRPVFSNKAIYGGLLSRCLIVYGDKVRHRNSLMWEDKKKYQPEPLREMLKDISNLRGIFEITEEAKIHYDSWYNDVCPTLESKANRTGAEGRIHVSVLKVAMILAAAKYKKLLIDIKILNEAIDRCQSLFVNYKRLTMGGRSKDADSKVLFLQLLWSSGEEKKYTMSRRDIIRASWGDMPSEELDSIVRNLLEGGFITLEEKREMPYYKLTDFTIEYFQKHKT